MLADSAENAAKIDQRERIHVQCGHGGTACGRKPFD
jgi:hypothetical protein